MSSVITCHCRLDMDDMFLEITMDFKSSEGSRNPAVSAGWIPGTCLVFIN